MQIVPVPEVLQEFSAGARAAKQERSSTRTESLRVNHAQKAHTLLKWGQLVVARALGLTPPKRAAVMPLPASVKQDISGRT